MDYKKKFDLSNKTSIVTGGGSGLGKEIARALAQFGSNVVIADIREDQALEAAEEINLNGAKVLAVPVDVSDEEQVIQLVNKTMEQFGKIDVLVNNAGIMQKKGKFEEMSLHEWESVMKVNLNSVFLMSKYVGKEMIKREKGSIINTASISSFIANKEPHCAYNTSKAGIHMMTKSLASEWAEHNIRVNSIAPGYMKTNMTKELMEDKIAVEQIENLIPLKKIGDPSEIAGLAVLLASDASGYTTGSVIPADGGYMTW
ncbi:SDR family NAD(P)-dependent oxidoreductase [Siminovitchia sediminis]|uniref:SDR family NAD(P)-dependent oxidoreductase n=1 Tax=Siminovitchia sediminis TaxID=1274353 RepID=A0ABW4KL01_9BACI